MPPFQNGKKCSGYVLSSKMCEIWDGYRLVVLQWFHMIHLRIQGGSFRCEAEHD